jgi:hypothetical protein
MKGLLEFLKKLTFAHYSLAGVVVFGAFALLWVVLTVFFSNAYKAGPVKQDPNHCPDCGREYSRAGMAAKECAFCLAQGGQGDKRGPNKPGLPGSNKQQTSLTVPITLFTIFFVMLGIHLTVVWRAAVAAAKEEVYYNTNCLKCDRKVRYRENQIGKVVGCPNPKCKSFIRCPEPVQEPSRPWWQFWGGQTQTAEEVHAAEEPKPEASATRQAGR